jgi:hypothetical protein
MDAVRKIISADMLTPIIDLPWKAKGMQVEVIVIPYIHETSQKRDVSIQSLKGCLKEYANPALRNKEKQAWENSVAEKYGHF